MIVDSTLSRRAQAFDKAVRNFQPSRHPAMMADRDRLRPTTAAPSRDLNEPCPVGQDRSASSYSNIIDSTVAAASREIPGVTWEYMSSVIAIEEWPSRSDTIFG